MPFFPNYILRDVLAWYVALAVLAALAAFSSVGAREEGRSVRGRAARHQAGVVFPGDVPHAEAPAEPRARASKASVSASIGVRDRRRLPGVRAVSRSPVQRGQAAARVHNPGGAGLLYLVVFTIIGRYAG